MFSFIKQTPTLGLFMGSPFLLLPVAMETFWGFPAWNHGCCWAPLMSGIKLGASDGRSKAAWEVNGELKSVMRNIWSPLVIMGNAGSWGDPLRRFVPCFLVGAKKLIDLDLDFKNILYSYFWKPCFNNYWINNYNKESQWLLKKNNLALINQFLWTKCANPLLLITGEDCF